MSVWIIVSTNFREAVQVITKHCMIELDLIKKSTSRSVVPHSRNAALQFEFRTCYNFLRKIRHSKFSWLSVKGLTLLKWVSVNKHYAHHDAFWELIVKIWWELYQSRIFHNSFRTKTPIVSIFNRIHPAAKMHRLKKHSLQSVDEYSTYRHVKF